ncbi:uncharacterized protein N0V89_003446 [Didymosphaeria variabile]|uniref:EthD domain-containing protein n=1 Tax=Didymosphaeria variabile TaxID=1932322 RepID=A0A9W8XQI6_9PLEO|nr:uncharacterized protein N0V89_003446 [Didymosphaeria variabile]KAJ4355430.1 hypothetical protein N0V89_003446 [Didymosphaeria variabile]
MPPGILWVSSRLSPPPQLRLGVDVLTPEKFCNWYEETHIQEVTALPGVPGAMRWEAVYPQPSATAWSVEAPWLTVYSMPDVEYRNSRAFKGLDGQSAPKVKLLREVFEQARFDTRFYEQISPTSSEAGGPTPEYVLSWAGDHVGAALLEGVEGVRRVRVFRVVGASTLERFVRRDALAEGAVKEGLMLVEVGEEAVERVRSVVERHGKEGDEVGWFGVKRVYGDGE